MKPLSASELALWRKDKNLYYKRYILGETEPPNEKMKLGTLIHKAIENPKYPWLKIMVDEKYDDTTIRMVRKIMDKIDMEGKFRDGKPEVVLRAETENGIPLIAIPDRLNKVTRKMRDYKTTDNKFRWNKYRVDVNFQLTFYAYVYHLLYHQYFTEMFLDRIYTVTGTILSIPTIRSKTDIDMMDRIVHRSVAEMKAAGIWEKRLTKEERLKENQLKIIV